VKLRELRQKLAEGLVIPAHPLALTAQRTLDERRQRALTRYYLDAGAGGIAVGVHTTQFAIRAKEHGLYRPVLALASEETAGFQERTGKGIVRIAGVIGPTVEALEEAQTAAGLGYDAVLLSLGWARGTPIAELVAHCREVSRILPLVGFYLQPAAGGIILPLRFWQLFLEIEGVAAIKVAPFNRYQTIDVARAVADSGRAEEVTLYTGNDDAIVTDLLTPFRFTAANRSVEVRFRGGLLGHWAVWTRAAVRMVEEINRIVLSGAPLSQDLLALGAQVTDANAAFYDAANGFKGCIAGVHEVLVRAGLMAGRWCLDPAEDLSPGQAAEIDRVIAAYTHLGDFAFVSENLERWLS
jgi:dihydrodipicolinate synthase/N-acetylneuraminate lyase